MKWKNHDVHIISKINGQYNCKDRRKIFTVTIGTIYENSKVELIISV